MYIGIVLILVGESIFAKSVNLGVYALSVFVLFNVFILIYEEPTLKKRFGDEYLDYCRKVRRWI